MARAQSLTGRNTSRRHPGGEGCLRSTPKLARLPRRVAKKSAKRNMTMRMGRSVIPMSTLLRTTAGVRRGKGGTTKGFSVSWITCVSFIL
eukprot:CAMPEP_0174746096 /NCGR_PEP_ID=MMETSP1094-20130205/88334_1 /TAXON_ID=156173 /ORGANISM="Chrysochromulina brevifilum, Strain UTEX LB 985" /LENGTH=89 /DNA_ID=CAMNT_0015950759 /DNA_START=301 /DNA_END=567 /DNA_ORIENTATION=+